jgi:hypothetical protein
MVGLSRHEREKTLPTESMPCAEVNTTWCIRARWSARIARWNRSGRRLNAIWPLANGTSLRAPLLWSGDGGTKPFSKRSCPNSRTRDIRGRIADQVNRLLVVSEPWGAVNTRDGVRETLTTDGRQGVTCQRTTITPIAITIMEPTITTPAKTNIIVSNPDMCRPVLLHHSLSSQGMNRTIEERLHPTLGRQQGQADFTGMP